IIGDVSFFGLGCEIPRYCQAAWNESMTEQAAHSLLTKTEAYDVLVTHTPPKGHVDVEHDDDHQGGHDGSASILRAIEERQPHFHFCGHMHDSWGQLSQVGQTRIYNLGPTLNWFDI
ncbi:MAG: metallophosphoesterase family protein, partial [Geminicoccaceae bacterium]